MNQLRSAGSTLFQELAEQKFFSKFDKVSLISIPAFAYNPAVINNIKPNSPLKML